MRGLSDEQVGLAAARARALGEPKRLRILESLSRGEQPVGQIAVATGTQQSTVSKHLQVLYQAGLVDRRREASTVLYSLADDGILEWLRVFGARQVRGRTRPPIGSRGV